MDDRALAELRELSAQDGELAARATALRRLDAEVSGIRRRAEEIDAFLAGFPESEARAHHALVERRGEVERRRAQQAAAEAGLAQARDEAAQDVARRAVARAADHLSVAELNLSRAQAGHGELEHEQSSVPAEASELELRAAALSQKAAELPAPAGGLHGLGGWASAAHAELFVATSGIDARRERIVREANELASMLLGEATYGSTPEQALARVERYWTSSPGQVSESR
jgi:predicted  nucleic acid-binding Zn-ribbon protein